jgi:HEAT repeat protein
LGQIGAAAIPALITALGDAEPEVRYWAAHALGQIRQAAEALPALSKALKDPSEKDYEAAKNVLKTFE